MRTDAADQPDYVLVLPWNLGEELTASKVRVEDALFELADDDFCPVSLRNATAFGSHPGCVPTSC